jgi:hypothetical protein
MLFTTIAKHGSNKPEQSDGTVKGLGIITQSFKGLFANSSEKPIDISTLVAKPTETLQPSPNAILHGVPKSQTKPAPTMGEIEIRMIALEARMERLAGIEEKISELAKAIGADMRAIFERLDAPK